MHVTGMIRRVLRLELMAGMGLAALLLPAAAKAQGVSTATVLQVQTPASGPAQADVTVTGADGVPVSGIVNFMDGDRLVAQAALGANGEAKADFTLPGGDHNLTAVYLGDTAHRTSTSRAAQLQTESTTSSAPNFQLSLSPVAPSALPMTLAAGQSGSALVTVTPVNNTSLTAPMFVTLSCSGLPSLASCSFTPENVQILAKTPTSCPSGSAASACPPTSLLTISTQGTGTPVGGPVPPASRTATPIGIALLLPGMLGLGGIAWGARRRRWLQRLALIALIGLVTSLGTTGCNPFWYYYHHGPPTTPATPAGTYTVTVTAQTSNGITALYNTTTMVLTVN